MKKILLTMFALLALIGVRADEVDVTTHLKYVVNDNEVTITGFADDFTPGADYALVIPDEINGMPVVAIGNQSFLDKDNFTSLAVGKNVRVIGSDAFRRATALKSITFAPDGVVESLGESAFRGCAELTEFIMPNTVKEVGNMVLQANSKLARVTISNELEVLSENFLCNCPLLKTVEIPNSVKEIRNQAFWMSNGLETMIIPSSVTTFGSNIFKECTNLREVTFKCDMVPAGILADKANLETVVLGNGVKAIGSSAFANCPKLTDITIPASVANMDGGIFKGCTALATVKMEGTQITELKDELFSGCSALTGFSIPESVTSIGAGCFAQCAQLESVSIPTKVKIMGASAFRECKALRSLAFADGINLQTIPAYCFLDCTSLEAISIPASVKMIEAEAFRRASAMKRVTFAPDGVVELLGESAFRGCAELTEFIMPNTVKEVGNMVLQANPKLEKVVLSNQLTAISEQALCNCSMLTHIDIPTSVTAIGKRAFWMSSGGLETITIPRSVTSLGGELFFECKELRTIDLSECTQVWELYNGTTDVNTKYAAPADAAVLLPPYSNATASNAPPTYVSIPAQDDEGYYLIASPEDLNNFALLVRSTPNANARLTKDIVLSGNETMIGFGEDENNNIAYSGTFDGQGHIITLNFTGANKICRPYGGLFSWTDGATIKNLATTGNIETMQPKVGGIAAGIKGTLTMQNCKAAVTITAIVDNPTEMHLGGVLGYTHNADIKLTDCVACGSIEGGENVKYASDFFGRITNGTKVQFNYCLCMMEYDINLSTVGRLFIADTSNPKENYGGANNIVVKHGASTGGSLTNLGVNISSSASMMEVADGTVAAAMQNGRTESVWVQDNTNTPDLLMFVNKIEPTGIENAKQGTDDKVQPIYDLQGRKVKAPVTGSIYVMKGKKIVY